jgi:hypothetical protein
LKLFEKFPQGYHRLSDRLLELLKSRMTEADIQALFEHIGAEIATERRVEPAGQAAGEKDRDLD